MSARAYANSLVAVRDSVLVSSSLEDSAKAQLRSIPAGGPGLFPLDCFEFARLAREQQASSAG